MENEKELPRGWAVVKLGEFVISEKGKKPKNVSKEMTNRFDLPYVNIQAFEKNIIDEYTDGEGCVICDENDFLMVWDGSRSGYTGKAIKGALGSTLVKIQFPGILNDYAHYFLQSKYLEINTRAKGTGTPHVDPSLLWNYDFPIPPLPEQYRIVSKIDELFSELDNGIESLKAAQQQLKVYRQAVLKWAFEGKLTEEWRKRQQKLKSAYDLLKLIENVHIEMYKQRIETWEIDTNRAKNEGRRSPRKPQVQIINIQPSEENLADFNDVPGEWVYVYLNSIGDLERGKSKHRPRNDSKLFENGIYPFVQTGEVKAADKYIRQFSKAYNDFGLSQSKLWPVNTLCITIAANIAESAFLAIDACFPDSVVGFKAFDSIVLPEYVYYFMESVKQRIAAYAPATAQKNINLETLENLIIPICSIAEQDAIVQETESRLSVCEKMEEAIEQCLSKAKALHQSLLKKAFEGKLVPQDPNDEPAEKLLERIRAEKETQNVGSRITKRRINK